MDMEWTIMKKRGNFRPVLRYTLTLTEFEVQLGVPAVRVQSPIPKPPDAGWTHCWPGQNERAEWTPAEWYLLMTPSYRTVTVTEDIRLPWRADNAYPEVEAAFTQLREAFESALADAVESAPMEARGSMQTSAAAKRTIAPAFAAERLLRAVRG